MAKLKEEFPTDWEERIERLSYYMESKGVSYKNHLATIRSWARKDNSYGYQRTQAPDHDWSKLDSIQPVKVLHEGEW